MFSNKRTHNEEGDDLAFLAEPKRARFSTPATPPPSDAEDCNMDNSIDSLCVAIGELRSKNRRGILYVLRDQTGIISVGSARNAGGLPSYDVDTSKLYWGHTMNIERDMKLATAYFGDTR